MAVETNNQAPIARQGEPLDPMPLINQERPLKVCYTCRFWSYKYKGFCQRLGQGVGRFWLCADWTAEGGEPEVSPERQAAPAPPPSS